METHDVGGYIEGLHPQRSDLPGLKSLRTARQASFLQISLLLTIIIPEPSKMVQVTSKSGLLSSAGAGYLKKAWLSQSNLVRLSVNYTCLWTQWCIYHIISTLQNLPCTSAGRLQTRKQSSKAVFLGVSLIYSPAIKSSILLSQCLHYSQAFLIGDSSPLQAATSTLSC